MRHLAGNRRFWLGVGALLLLLGGMFLGGALRPASRISPEHALARDYSARGGEVLRQKNYDQAVSYFSRAIDLYHQALKSVWDRVDADIDYQQAVVASHRIADFDSVDIDNGFQDALHIRDEMTLCHSRRGVAYQEMGEHAEAIRDFTMVIRWNESPRAYERRARSYRAMGKFDKAEKDELRARRAREDAKDRAVP